MICICLPRFFNANLSPLLLNKKLSMAVVPTGSELNLVILLYTKKIVCLKGFEIRIVFMCLSRPCLFKVSWSFGYFSASVTSVLFPMCTDNVLSFPIIKQTERKLNTKLSNSKNTNVNASPIKVGPLLVWK